MAEQNASSDRGEENQLSRVEQLLARTLDQLAVVMLTRDRIQDTLEEAVERGRVTRSDANELAAELVRRGRVQTEELLAELERILDSSRERLGSAGRRSRLGEGVTRLADRARRSVAGGGFPIIDYDGLTARQVQGRLGDLAPAELRSVAEYERRHANRKTVLDAIDRALG